MRSGSSDRVCSKLGICWSCIFYLQLCSKTASAIEQGCEADRSFHSSLFLCTACHDPVLQHAATSCMQASRQRVARVLQNRSGFTTRSGAYACHVQHPPSDATHEASHRNVLPGDWTAEEHHSVLQRDVHPSVAAARDDHLLRVACR